MLHAQLHSRTRQRDSTPGRARPRPGAERFCAATGTVKPVAEMIRFVLGARRRGRARSQAPAAGPRHLDHGHPRGARQRGRPQGLCAQLQARRAAAAGLRRRDRAAAGTLGARCARDRPQGRKSRDRLRQGRGGAGARQGRGPPACRRGRAGRGAKAQAARGARPPDGGAGSIAGDRSIYLGAIGFGIGAVKCDTCSAAGRPRKRDVSGARAAPRALPDRRSGRWGRPGGPAEAPENWDRNG